MTKFLCSLILSFWIWIPTSHASTGYLYSVNIVGFAVRSVSIIDLLTNTILTSSLPSFSTARSITANPTGTIVYITKTGDNTVSVIDAQSFTVIQSISVGNAPNVIVASPDGTKLYVDDTVDKTVTVIDVTNYTVEAIIYLGTTGFGPSGMAISPDSATLYVCNSEENTVSVIDTATNTITGTISIDGSAWPIFVTFNAEGTKAYVANEDAGTVSVIDTATREVTNTIPVGTQMLSEPTSIALNSAQHTAYTTNKNDNTVTVIDTDLNTVLSNISTGNAPESIVINYDNTKAYVAIKNDQTIGVLDLNSNTFTDNITLVHSPFNLALFYQVTANISSDSLVFSDQNINTTSSAQLTFTNTDGPAVTINDIEISGDFSQTNNCGPKLATLASCTITVMFNPVTTGSHTGLLTINSIDTNSPHIVSLSGTGVVPVIAFSANSLTFSNQIITTESVTQPLSITNTGTIPIEISSITASGDFSQNNTCGSSVAPGDTCKIHISFIPTELGTRTGKLNIADNVSGSPHEILLSGTSIANFSGGGCSLVTD